MAMRVRVLKIATGFKMNLPKRFPARLKPVFGRTQVGGMWGAGLVADLARVLFEQLAEEITVVDDLNHRGFCARWLSRRGWARWGLPAKAS